jgi:hypothetical protein
MFKEQGDILHQHLQLAVLGMTLKEVLRVLQCLDTTIWLYWVRP